jgi:putative membrane protein
MLKAQFANLHESRIPNAFRLRGSVILPLIPKVLFMGIFSVVITLVNENRSSWGAHLGFATSLITVMGTVASLLLVFRTNTAYDRYWEGRKLWGSLIMAVRNEARLIWVGVQDHESRDLIEKKSAINLLVGFVVATKHYLREEYDTQYADLVDYIIHVPQYAIPSAVEQKRYKSKPKPATKKESIANLLGTPAFDGEYVNPEGSKNIPLELSLYLSAYIHKQKARAAIDLPQFTLMCNALVTMMDCLTSFERIQRSPIPLAYSIHLSQTVWIYCLALSFQLVDSLRWVTVPCVMLASFTLFGIEAIGAEIEDPFGYDANDLPLDDFCELTRRELENITSAPPPDPEDWVHGNAHAVLHEGISREVEKEFERRAGAQFA